MKEYPAKLRLTTLQCFFSCIQSAIWAISVKRDIAAWKLGFNFNLLSVAYCVRTFNLIPIFFFKKKQIIFFHMIFTQFYY